MDGYSLGKNIQNQREKHNMNQMQLAEKTGLTSNYISAIERGIKIPKSAYIQDHRAEELQMQLQMEVHYGHSTRYKFFM